MWVLFGLIILILLTVFYQDMKNRAVTFLLLPLLIIVEVLYKYILNSSFGFFYADILPNLVIFAFLILFVWGYFALKQKKTNLIVSNYFGGGDLWIVFYLCVALPFGNALLVIVLGSIAALCSSFLLNKLTKYKWKTIPFAGILAMLMIFVKMHGAFTHSSFNQQSIFYGI